MTPMLPAPEPSGEVHAASTEHSSTMKDPLQHFSTEDDCTLPQEQNIGGRHSPPRDLPVAQQPTAETDTKREGEIYGSTSGREAFEESDHWLHGGAATFLPLNIGVSSFKSAAEANQHKPDQQLLSTVTTDLSPVESSHRGDTNSHLIDTSKSDSSETVGHDVSGEYILTAADRHDKGLESMVLPAMFHVRRLECKAEEEELDNDVVWEQASVQYPKMEGTSPCSSTASPVCEVKELRVEEGDSEKESEQVQAFPCLPPEPVGKQHSFNCPPLVIFLHVCYCFLCTCPLKTPQPFHRNVQWNIEDIRMLLGSDLPIFGTRGHPAISLRLRYAYYTCGCVCSQSTYMSRYAIPPSLPPLPSQRYEEANHSPDGTGLLARQSHVQCTRAGNVLSFGWDCQGSEPVTLTNVNN